MHQLLQALHQKLAALRQGPEGLVSADKPISYRTKPPASIHRELLGVCSDPYTLAQQLTHVELVSRPKPPSSPRIQQDPHRYTGPSWLPGAAPQACEGGPWPSLEHALDAEAKGPSQGEGGWGGCFPLRLRVDGALPAPQALFQCTPMRSLMSPSPGQAGPVHRGN